MDKGNHDDDFNLEKIYGVTRDLELDRKLRILINFAEKKISLKANIKGIEYERVAL